MLLTELIGIKKTPGHIGIEIEVEGLKELPYLDNAHWISKADNSLRHSGMEYITKGTIKVDSAKLDKIDWLIKKIREHKIVEDSPRTSVHVHVNVSQFEVLHIINAMTAYWLFENVLMRFCGEDREGNLFCLRLKDAEAIIELLVNDLNGSRPFKQIGDRVRYAGLNINAVGRFGSLEFRGMRGTLDPKLIDLWSTECYNLVEACKAFSDPEDLFNSLLRHSKQDFLEKFFSKKFASALMLINGWDDMIDEGAALVCTLAYAIDWPKWEKRLKDKPKVKMNRDLDWAMDAMIQQAGSVPQPAPISNVVSSSTMSGWVSGNGTL